MPLHRRSGEGLRNENQRKALVALAKLRGARRSASPPATSLSCSSTLLKALGTFLVEAYKRPRQRAALADKRTSIATALLTFDRVEQKE